MFKKLKGKIKTKMQTFLELDELDKKVTINDSSIGKLYDVAIEKSKEISQLDTKIEILHRTIENITYIGTDVHCHRDNSMTIKDIF